MKTDLEIQNNVIEELKWESFLKSSDIGVSVIDGVVTLTGFVDSYSKIRLAESVVFRIVGVKAIAEDIIVRFDKDEKISDAEIAEAVANVLKFQTHSNRENIKVKVEDGWVTLTGEVNLFYEKKTIRKLIENIKGVKAISNQLIITTKASFDPKKIKSAIMAAFHRSATIEANSIIVSGLKNKVILRGVVHSNAEKQEAERVAWNAPGILEVDNRLEVVLPVIDFTH